MHIDLSLVSDCTGIALCHRDKELVNVDLLLKIRPPKDGEIDLAEIVGLVRELQARHFFIKKCTFDQFQSASSIQELNKLGIVSERLSVDKDMAAYETLKEALYTKHIRMYRSQDLFDEMMRLELVEGKKVEHPARGEGKDLSDALAGAVFNCISDQNNFMCWVAGNNVRPKTEEEIKKESEVLAVDGLVPYGYFRGRRSY
jgi:phage terminase large subunit-like protein